MQHAATSHVHPTPTTPLRHDPLRRQPCRLCLGWGLKLSCHPHRHPRRPHTRQRIGMVALLHRRVTPTPQVVVSNNPTCGGCAYAAQHGIPVEVYPASTAHPDALTPAALVDALQTKHAAQFVLLAGYLKVCRIDARVWIIRHRCPQLIPPELVRAYPRRMLNIHPALLPSFGGVGMYGQRVHRAVVASGACCHKFV